VLIAIFDLSLFPIILMGFAFAVIAMCIATINGLDRVPRVLAKVARIHRMAEFDTALKLKLPAAAPHLFTGVKLCLAYSFIGVIASEFILAPSGLGHAIAYAYNDFDNRTMYALMLFVMVAVITLNMLLHGWEQRLLKRWQGR
jgi:NitT/TauT family transport system permease protein